MAATTSPLGFNVLPQYAPNAYDIQTKQALAQALMQRGLQGNLAAYQPAGGGFQYVPSMGIGGAIAGSVLPSLLGSALQRQAGQEMQQLGAQQWASLTGQGSSPTQAAAQAGPAGPASSELAAALGGGGGPSQAAPTPQTAPLQPGGILNPAGLPVGLAAQEYLRDPAAYTKEFVAPYYKPSDVVSQARAAGIDPNSALGRQIGQQALSKALNVPLQGFAPGQTVFNQMTGQSQVIPNIGEGMELVRRPDGSTYVAEIPGYARTVGGIEGARAVGRGVLETEPVWQQNPDGTWQQVRQTKANIAASAGAPGLAGAQTPFQQAQVMTESGGRPDAVSPKGAMGAWQVMPNTNRDPGFGVAPARDNSRAELDRVGREYSDAMLRRYNGNQQLGAIAYNMGPGATDAWLKKGARFEDLPRETKDYMGKIALMTSMGAPQQPQQAAPAGRGPMFSSPPLGAEAEATSNVQSQSEAMRKSYEGLRTARDSSQNAITLLDDMQKYATDKNPVLANKLFNVQNLYSTNAQLFDKARSNLIAQVAGSTGMGTDQARAIVEGSIPSYGMSQAAIQEGLNDIKGQVQMRRIKSDYMSDAYAGNNARVYNQRENQFDQSMTPRAANIIAMPPGQARNNAIQAARQNPRDADALRWALQTGLLK